MDPYKEPTALRCFTRGDMVRITGSESAAQGRIKNCLRKGYIERVRRGLYAVVGMETEQPIHSCFQIASRAADDAHVSHHSAFEFHGYANRAFYDLYFGTENKALPFDYDGLRYWPVVRRGKTGIRETGNGVSVTSPERTAADGMADFTRIGGPVEPPRCLALIPSLYESGLPEAPEVYGRAQLCQKTGYILGTYKDEL